MSAPLWYLAECSCCAVHEYYCVAPPVFCQYCRKPLAKIICEGAQHTSDAQLLWRIRLLEDRLANQAKWLEELQEFAEVLEKIKKNH